MPDSSGQTQAYQLQGDNPNTDLSYFKDELYAPAKSTREQFIPEWYMNLAFYMGQQWLYWNANRLTQPTLAKWRKTPVDNRILPIVTARVARKVKNRPAFVCTPNTGDEADIEASRVGERVLAADWLGLSLQQQLYQAMLYADICGAGFWKIYWDSTEGKSVEVVVGPDGNPLMNGNGTPIKVEDLGELPEGLQTKAISQGDVCVDVLSPFELYPDPLAKTLDKCEWIIEEKVRSVEYVKRRYNVELEPDADAPSGPMESRLAASMVVGTIGGSPYKGIKVLEAWVRPSTKFPQGKHVVWAKEQILMDEDNPFDALPYVMFGGVRAPDRFWPTSLVTQLRGPQTDLNKIQSQILENASRLGNLSLMKSRQANVAYSGVPGEEVLYDSTVTDAVPQFLAPPEMPAYVREQVERIENSMAEISGLHDVSKATVPSGVTAASAINLLQEADDTRLGPEIQDMELALGKAGTKILKLRAAYNTDERIIRIAGEDGDWDIFSFRGEVLKDNTNVEVQAGSAMPRSKAAKQAAMLEVLQTAVQYGMEFDPRDLRKFFQDYEVAALERLFGTIGVDEQQINREHRIMAGGQPLNINTFDDHQLHADAHDEYRKSAKYQRQPPEIKQLFDLHADAHREYLVQQTNAQMGAMATEQQQQAQLQQQQQMELQAQQQAQQPPADGG